jgi:SAM-dependent methyltransferase
MVELSGEQLKEVVRENYAKVAQGAASCCDADSACCGSNDLYDVEQIKGLPVEAVMASAGCGNPTAIGSLEPGETVVDFGSGGGIDCFIAAKQVGPQGRVIGVDMTPDMVELARSNARKLEMSNVEFHLTEMENTPIESDSVDVIISNCVINLAPDKDAVFKEAYRILKPGGRMFISDMVLIDKIPANAIIDVKEWVACLAGAELKDVYLGKMKNAGLTNIEITAENPYQIKEGWQASVRSLNIRAFKPA